MYQKISVYVVAHQDDWQLFMDPNVSKDLTNPTCKTIIIHTTAGDAGNNETFWRCREVAAIDSILFRIGKVRDATCREKFVRIGNKKLWAMQKDNCDTYFLRLPDGGMYGDGFEKYSFCSLSKIRQKKIKSLQSVDGQIEFKSFAEISNLLNEIVSIELSRNEATNPKLVFNFPETDPNLNPEDHNDHFNTALLIQGMDLYADAKKYAYVHYETHKSGTDLEGEELFWKMGMFCVYHQSIMDEEGYSTIDESPLYKIWCMKNTLYREIA